MVRRQIQNKHDNKKQGEEQERDEGFQALSSLFNDYQVKDGGNYITREFQDYGYRLACKLNDLEHKSLYIKMAKEEKRILLERALRFVIDANARSKAKLFMWKLKQLKQDKSKQDKQGEQESLTKNI
jgi:hypothetical protein